MQTIELCAAVHAVSVPDALSRLALIGPAHERAVRRAGHGQGTSTDWDLLIESGPLLTGCAVSINETWMLLPPRPLDFGPLRIHPQLGPVTVDGLVVVAWPAPGLPEGWPLTEPGSVTARGAAASAWRSAVAAWAREVAA